MLRRDCWFTYGSVVRLRRANADIHARPQIAASMALRFTSYSVAQGTYRDSGYTSGGDQI